MSAPTPQEWQDALSVTRSVSEQRNFVVRHARAFLARGLVRDCSTAILCETLWPAQYAASAAAIHARKRMINHLLKAARNDLSDCATKAPETRKYMGRDIHPWLWNAPHSAAQAPANSNGPALLCCPHCGGDLTAQEIAG